MDWWSVVIGGATCMKTENDHCTTGLTVRLTKFNVLKSLQKEIRFAYAHSLLSQIKIYLFDYEE